MTDSPAFSRQAAWGLPRFSLPSRFVGSLGASLDIGVLLVAGAFAGMVCKGWRNMSAPDLDACVVASLAFLLIGKYRGLYTIRTLVFPERNLSILLVGSLLAAVAAVVLMFVLHGFEKHPRGVELLFALFAMMLAPPARLAFARFLSAAHAADRVIGRSVALIGDRCELDRLASEDWLQLGVSEIARVALADDSNSLSDEDRGRIALAIRLARTGGAVEFALLIPWRHDRRIAETVKALRASPLGVRLYPDAATRALLAMGQSVHADPYLSVELRRPPLGPIDRAAKRAFDIIVATAALVALTPVLLLLGLVVRATSPGSAIFKQTRRGFDGREFRIWKFRTMTVVEDGPGLRQAARGDARVTPVGRWLRRMSLDELPQLVNVLKGEMSLIGPRPHALAQDDAFGAAIREYALRRHVKPGLTGAAQAVGLRGETRTIAQMEARVARDLWYIDNWSLWLDVRIAFQTLSALFKHEAY